MLFVRKKATEMHTEANKTDSGKKKKNTDFFNILV